MLVGYVHTVYGPYTSRFVREQAAVPHSRHKATGLERGRTVLAYRERPHRGIAYVISIAITTQLRTRNGISQIILPFVLEHRSPFRPRIAAFVVVTAHFVAMLLRVCLDTNHIFRQRLEVVIGVQFATTDSAALAASPISVDTLVIVHEYPWVVPRMGVVANLIPPSALGVLAPVNGTALRRSVVHPFPYLPDCRGILFNVKGFVGCYEMPVRKVFRPPVSSRFGREQVIVALVQNDHRVGCFPVGTCFQIEAVLQIQGIAKRVLCSRLPHCSHP